MQCSPRVGQTNRCKIHYIQFFHKGNKYIHICGYHSLNFSLLNDTNLCTQLLFNFYLCLRFFFFNSFLVITTTRVRSILSVIILFRTTTYTSSSRYLEHDKNFSIYRLTGNTVFSKFVK